MTTMKNAALVLALALSNVACSSSGMVDFAMSSAKSPASHRALTVGDRTVLAGDMHCHVLPPDSRWHVSRELPETIARAKKEDFDFVVLTPHIPARFFLDADERAWVVRTQRELRARLATLDVGGVVVVPGFEYTDRRYGHVGGGFADVEPILESLSLEEAHARPEAFFERFLAAGGTLVVNHPVERPLPHAPFSPLRYDLSWRAWAAPPPRVLPPEIAFVTTHAQGVETFNASITHLRDQFILGDEERTLREASMLVDRAARDQRRRIAHVGGSDSHGSWLFPTTYVLAKEKSASAIRAAIAEGRTCVRGPEACTFELRAGDGAWVSVGDAIAPGTPGVLEARANGDLVVLVNGVATARAARGQTARVEVPTDRCTMVRAMVGPLSWSSPIYVGCGF